MRVHALVGLGLALAAVAPAQDAEWVRAWERAQRDRPARLESVARIAPANEPGTPLAIDGRVFLPDGRTPASGVTVFAYQTDAAGHYDVPSAGPHSWRLRGWAVTDNTGRFTFHTIRPASYPNSTVAQHVHVTIEGPKLPRRWTPEIQFDDDPKIGARERDASRAAGIFGSVRPVLRQSGVDRVAFNIRIENSGLF